MKLYLSPGACSLASHIALHEADVAFEHESVDLRAKKTEGGADFSAINPKGYVPALILDDGSLLTENVALLDWIAAEHPRIGNGEGLGRTRLIEALAFISTEIHKQFKPLFRGDGEDAQKMAKDAIAKRLKFAADAMQGDYMLGKFTVADCYLFVMYLWSQKFGIDIPAGLADWFTRMKSRPAVKTATEHEGLKLG